MYSKLIAVLKLRRCAQVVGGILERGPSGRARVSSGCIRDEFPGERISPTILGA
ncbi:MAG: hypothetical protein QXH90_08055 [Candidatus Korarchaeum sp.]